MSDADIKHFLLRASAALLLVFLLYVAIRYLLPRLLPFLLAAAITSLVEPAVRGLQARLSFQRSFSSLLLTLFMLFLFGGLLSLLGTTLVQEAASLLSGLPTLLATLPAALSSLLSQIDGAAAGCPPWLCESIRQSLMRYAVDAGDLINSLLARLLVLLGAFAARLPQLFLAFAVCILATYYTSSAWPQLRAYYYRLHIASDTRQKLRRLRDGILSSCLRWLRAELTLCTITFALLLSGFLFLKEPYALLLAFLITLLDALPVFGTGTALVPWALTELLFQHVPQAIILTLLFLITLTVRNVLEPRLLGAQAGLPPIASLFAMYIGFCTFGVTGMILFPFLLLLFSQLRSSGGPITTHERQTVSGT